MHDRTETLLKSALILAMALVTGCASPQKVSPNVTAMLQEMNQAQAALVLQSLLPPRNHYGNATRTLISGHIGLGLCRASNLSLDEQRGPDLQVSTNEISFNAVMAGALVKDNPQGRIASLSGASSIHQYERVFYKEHILFEKIDSVSVTEPGLLRTLCGRQTGQSEVVIHESASRWYAALIPTADKDRFIAAVMRLKPGLSIMTELPDD